MPCHDRIIDFSTKRNKVIDDPAFNRWLGLEKPKPELDALRYTNMPNTYWRCTCGCVYFFIAPNGLVCAECGNEPKGF
jgi:hypothetical protein